jgi:hypothetical protein
MVLSVANFYEFQKNRGIFLVFLLVFILEIFSPYFFGFFLIPMFIFYFFNEFFIKRALFERNIMNFFVKNAAAISFFYLIILFESYAEKFF